MRTSNRQRTTALALSLPALIITAGIVLSVQLRAQSTSTGSTAGGSSSASSTATSAASSAPSSSPSSNLNSNGAPATITLIPLTQYGADKYSIRIDDQGGIWEMSILTQSGGPVWGGGPGGPGLIGSCTGSTPWLSLTSGTVTLQTTDFPLHVWGTHCASTYVYTFDLSIRGEVLPYSTPAAVSSASSSSTSSSLRSTTGSSSLVISSSSSRWSVSSPSSTASCGSNNEIRASCQCGSKWVTIPSAVGEKYCCTVNGYTYSTSVICPQLQTPATGSAALVTTPGTTYISGSVYTSVPAANSFSTGATTLPPLPGVPGVPSVVPGRSQQPILTQTPSVTVYRKLSASKMRVLRSKKKSMLKELTTMERVFRIAKDAEALEQLAEFRAELEAFVPLDTSANELMADFQDEIVELRLQLPKKKAKR